MGVGLAAGAGPAGAGVAVGAAVVGAVAGAEAGGAEGLRAAYPWARAGCTRLMSPQCGQATLSPLSAGSTSKGCWQLSHSIEITLEVTLPDRVGPGRLPFGFGTGDDRAAGEGCSARSETGSGRTGITGALTGTLGSRA